MQYEVSITVYMGRIANQRKVPIFMLMQTKFVWVNKGNAM